MRLSATLVACALTAIPAAQGIAPARAAYLSGTLGFSASEIGAVNRGQAVARMLPTGDRREFAAVGVVRVGVPPAFIVERFRDIVEYKQSDLVLQVGLVSSAPRVEDFASLVIDREDLDDLRWCQPGDCGLRLTHRQIARFRAIDWGARQSALTAGHLLRTVLAEEATAYLRSGGAGLGPYADKRTPLDRNRAVNALLQHSPSFVEPHAEFRQYLLSFPQIRLEGVESFLYWSREKFGFRPVVSLTHVAIYRPPAGGPVTAIIASRQVFATHYFDASIAMTTLVADGEADGEARAGALMMYLNRTQASLPGGLFSPVARSIARSRTRNGLREQLDRTRMRLEASYRKSG
jgi:hypothetical protein